MDQAFSLPRRHFVLTAMALLAGCGTDYVASQRGAGNSALLLPMTGANAGIGGAMAQAADLAGLGRAPESMPRRYDTADTAEGAAAAAQAAIDDGAQLLMGPLRSDQTPAVQAIAGAVPVVTFSNDDRLQGVFVFGVTAAQSVAAMFSYALSQGINRVAVVAAPGPLGAATGDAAVSIAAAGGLNLSAVVLRDPAAPGLVQALREASGGVLPQAVFLPDGGAALTGFLRGLRGSSMRILGSVQWGIGDSVANPDLEGAAFAAPAPDLFQPFSDRYLATYGAEPGVVAALGHDAVLMALGLGDAGALNRQGLLRKAGFTGVLGGFRFDKTGRCHRDLAVLAIEGGKVVIRAEVAGT
ncbi:MAG: penicillin-binding protein activator [Pseudorhodobacter sp.]|nr:penicillin-binding protein activator [Pseudorhodobacter sp.]